MLDNYTTTLGQNAIAQPWWQGQASKGTVQKQAFSPEQSFQSGISESIKSIRSADTTQGRATTQLQGIDSTHTFQGRMAAQLRGMDSTNTPQGRITAQLKSVDSDNTSQGRATAQLQDIQNEGAPTQQQATPSQNNSTGMPDNLKSGIENLSGYAMDDVKVHYNSSKPAQLQAHAYAQGTDIHLAPGQEKHLPHEAWHIIQQKQGRVRPTKQLKGKVNVNDDAGLEKEADVMGARAVQHANKATGTPYKVVSVNTDTLQREIKPNKLNMVGENHKESENRREEEMRYAEEIFGPGNYWLENKFKVINEQDEEAQDADPIHLRILQRLTNAKLTLKILVPKINTVLKGNRNPALLEEIKKYLDRMPPILINAWGMLKDNMDIAKDVNFAANIFGKRTNPNTVFGTCYGAAKDMENYGFFFSNEYLEDSNDREQNIQYSEILKTVTKYYREFRTIETSKHKFGVNLYRRYRVRRLKDLYTYTSKKRSRSMHEAAKLMQDKKGIWKVGEDHIQHILDDMGRTAEYNIVTLAEFNEDLKKK